MSKEIYDIEDIKNKLKKVLKKYPVYKVILFGSYAKNNPNEDSDIDFIIDTKSELLGFKLYALINILEKEFGKKIDAFENIEIIENSRIDREIKETGVVVYEKL